MPADGVITTVINQSLINIFAWCLPDVASVPPGTEPDWQVWRYAIPKSVLFVGFGAGTPPYIIVNTTLSGGVATRLKYTYNPARPIPVVGGGHLLSFDVTVPYP